LTLIHKNKKELSKLIKIYARIRFLQKIYKKTQFTGVTNFILRIKHKKSGNQLPLKKTGPYRKAIRVGD
jgi:hypothetical protein